MLVFSSLVFQKCADTKVSDKRVYYTFARTLPPSSKVSKSVVALLRAFSWDKFVIVASRRPAWGGQVKDAIKHFTSDRRHERRGSEVPVLGEVVSQSFVVRPSNKKRVEVLPIRTLL
uniref:Receptor ligand binding region domain-containing protein n=1 Tax=Timema poppense TaxID=170557 RepID=A0A7R9CSG6_TIMPO|nr:unnamed protein product [Timema poppensis]